MNIARVAAALRELADALEEGELGAGGRRRPRAWGAGTVFQRPSGRWTIRLPATPHGRRARGSFASREEAQRALDAILNAEKD